MVGAFCLEAERDFPSSCENMTAPSHYLITNFTFSVIKRISITGVVSHCQFYYSHNFWQFCLRLFHKLSLAAFYVEDGVLFLNFSILSSCFFLSQHAHCLDLWRVELHQLSILTLSFITESSCLKFLPMNFHALVIVLE